MHAETSHDLLYTRDLNIYKSTKPYVFTFDVSEHGPEAQQTNLALEPHQTRFRNYKDAEHKFLLDVHGFEIKLFPFPVTPEQCSQDSFVRTNYYPQFEAFLRAHFGPKLNQVYILNH